MANSKGGKGSEGGSPHGYVDGQHVSDNYNDSKGSKGHNSKGEGLPYGFHGYVSAPMDMLMAGKGHDGKGEGKQTFGKQGKLYVAVDDWHVIDYEGKGKHGGKGKDKGKAKSKEDRYYDFLEEFYGEPFLRPERAAATALGAATAAAATAVAAATAEAAATADTESEASQSSAEAA
jgi:hypothetical protein